MSIRSWIRVFAVVVFSCGALCIPASLGAHPYYFTTALSQLAAPQTKLEKASVCMGNGIPAAAQELIEKPGPAFSAPVGAIAPSDASPTYRAWLEHEKAEPEPGSEYEI